MDGPPATESFAGPQRRWPRVSLLAISCYSLFAVSCACPSLFGVSAMAFNNTKKNRLPVFFLAAGSQCACFVYAQPPPAPVDVRAPVMGRVIRVRLAIVPTVSRGKSFFMALPQFPSRVTVTAVAFVSSAWPLWARLSSDLFRE